MDIGKKEFYYYLFYFYFLFLSMGTLISFALAKHMIDTNNKANLIQLMVQMGRGPPHLHG